MANRRSRRSMFMTPSQPDGQPFRVIHLAFYFLETSKIIKNQVGYHWCDTSSSSRTFILHIVLECEKSRKSSDRSLKMLNVVAAVY